MWIGSAPSILFITCTISVTFAFRLGIPFSSHRYFQQLPSIASKEQKYVLFSSSSSSDPEGSTRSTRRYDIGLGKNSPLNNDIDNSDNTNNDSSENSIDAAFAHWNVPRTLPLNVTKRAPSAQNVEVKSNSEPAENTTTFGKLYKMGAGKHKTVKELKEGNLDKNPLAKALWDKDHYEREDQNDYEKSPVELTYDQIDFSIPIEVYDPDNGIDLVWDLMRLEAHREAEREPLLVSFLFSTILNHPTLESALAFHLANRLSSPTMIGTQIQSIVMEALEPARDTEHGLEKYYLEFHRALRADILSVRDRDPACTCLPDVFLYFKGFHALQTYRVAHYLWKSKRQVLAHYLQSQVSQVLQIDIHPNATLGSGIMLDHGTGIVIGETAVVGHNCSILHHVTLGGSGKKGLVRHPKVGDGVLIGAGASLLGNIKIGDGVQIGAGTLVITDLPDHVVAVGVPAKIIGSFKDSAAQPSTSMNQTLVGETNPEIIRFVGDGI